MEKPDFISALERESAAFIEAVDGSLDVDVPACSEWTMRDLSSHVGKTWAIATTSVAAATDHFTSPGDRGRIPDDDALVVEWLQHVRTAMLSTMASTEPDADAWSFAANDQTAGFWQRRMAQETVVHNWDAHDAIGQTYAIDAELALDGINEYFAVGLQYSSSKPGRLYPSETLHLHRTDGDGEWMLRGDGDRVVVTEEHAKGDAAVRGSAEDLLLWIWGRSSEGVEILGDTEVADVWQALAP